MREMLLKLSSLKPMSRERVTFLRLAFVALLFALYVSVTMAAPAERQPPRKRAGAEAIDLTSKKMQERMKFEFSTQDGEFVMPCTFRVGNPVALNLEVTCTSPAGFSLPPRHFSVHLRLFAYTKPQAPRRSYELLYWVTDRDAKPGDGGRFAGTTLWYHLEDVSSLMRVDASQDIGPVHYLNLRLDLARPLQ